MAEYPIITGISTLNRPTDPTPLLFSLAHAQQADTAGAAFKNGKIWLTQTAAWLGGQSGSSSRQLLMPYVRTVSLQSEDTFIDQGQI
jgi:hypothetical protein